MLLPEYILLETPFLISFLFFLISVALSWLTYFRRFAELGLKLFSFLFSLRAASIFLILSLLLNPKLVMVYPEKHKDEFAVFIDNSFSMKNKQDAAYSTTIDHLLKRLYASIEGEVDLKLYTFNNQLNNYQRGDSLLLLGSTDLKQPLRKIKNSQIKHALLISDGNHTEGLFPDIAGMQMLAKVHTIGVGPIQAMNDLFIEKADFHDVVYKGEATKITAKITSKGLKTNAPISIVLKEGNKVLAQQSVQMNQANSSANIEFTIAPQNIGFRKMQLKLHAPNDDQNKANNEFVFMQNVLDKKVTVAVFSAYPTYESKFICNALEKNKDISILKYTHLSNKYAQFNRSLTNIKNIDAAIFIGYPNHKPSANWSLINKEIFEKNVNSIFLINEKTDAQSLQQLMNKIKAGNLFQKIKRQRASVSPAENDGKQNIMFPFPKKEQNKKFWENVSPLLLTHIYSGPFEAIKNVKINGKMYPVILYGAHKNRKIYVLNGEGFWKWNFLLQENEVLKNGYALLLEAIIRNAAHKDDIQPLSLSLNKNVYHIGDNIYITAKLYNKKFEPITSGSISLKIKTRQASFLVEMKPDSLKKIYTAQFIAKSEGDFVVTASASHEGEALSSKEETVTVIPFPLERLYTGQNSVFLNQIANAASGIYVDSANSDSLFKILKFTPEKKLQSYHYHLRYTAAIIILIIVLLAVEWVSRKLLSLS
jgi:hypothetical protein